jgi:hypothetical protein
LFLWKKYYSLPVDETIVTEVHCLKG